MKSVALLVLAALVVAPSSLLAQSRGTDTNAAEKEQKAIPAGKSNSSVQPKDEKELLDAVRLESSSVSAATLRKAEIIYRAMVNSRLKLRSGVFRAHGTTGQGTSPDSGGPFTFYSVFDNKDARLRFDLTCYENMDNAYRIVQSKFARTPERTMRWVNYVPHRLIVDSVDTKHSHMAICFDVRVLGLTSHSGLRGLGMITLEECCESLRNYEVVAVEEDNQGVRIDLRGRKYKSITFSYVFDPNKGYSPTRMESRMGKAYRSVHEVNWVKNCDTWVPATFSFETYRKGRLEDHLEMELSWESVNGVVDRKLFSGAMGLPQGIEVIIRADGDVGSERSLGTLGSRSVEELLNAR